MAKRYMKRWLTSPIFRKCKSKPQDITSHLSEWLLSKRQETACAAEDTAKREPLCTVGENINWYSYSGKQYGSCSKLPYDPASLLLDIYLKITKTLTQRDMYTFMSIAASFMITKIWKQPKSSLMDKWIKKMSCNGTLLSHKKEGNPAIYYNTDGLSGYCTKWISQIEKGKYYMSSPISRI